MDAATQAVLILLAALAVDALLGEYPRLLHPVVWIGQAATLCLRLAPARGWWRQLIFGALLALLLPAAAAGLTLLALWASSSLPVLPLVLSVFFLKASFALCELWRAALRVLWPLEQGDLLRAREALRSLCSRDPSTLEEPELLAATTESLAENASDSFVAPLFYYLLLGVPGAIAYRAINTLDAMIGYRGRYEALGKAAARLDDVVNFVPARLTALLFLLVGGVCGGSVMGGLRILRRDGARTPSPNGGRPMAVMAGLLGVELAKKGVYVLGDPLRPLSAAIVRQAWRVVLLAGLVMAGLCSAGFLVGPPSRGGPAGAARLAAPTVGRRRGPGSLGGPNRWLPSCSFLLRPLHFVRGAGFPFAPGGGGAYTSISNRGGAGCREDRPEHGRGGNREAHTRHEGQATSRQISCGPIAQTPNGTGVSSPLFTGTPAIPAQQEVFP